jgi:transposase-like protein
MSKVVTVCPHCKKANTVEKASSGVGEYAHGVQNIQCSHCSKSWIEDMDVTGSELAKSVQPTSLAALRVQVRAQFDELLKQINALQERRAAAARLAAKFNTSGVEKSDVAEAELKKALDNGTSLTFQTLSGVRSSGAAPASSGRFVPDGVEKSDVAGQELTKALANGKPVGFIQRGN